MRRNTPSTAAIYQLKVTLNGSKPPIWRRFQVPGNVRLSQLHQVLQAVMGWSDSHLHQFLVGGTCYGQPHPELDEMENENRVTLSEVAPTEGARFGYEYDFGDSWEHVLLVEKILPPEPGVTYPRCLTGKRNCPPEDCGGVWGYADFLEAIKDPQHPEHDELLEWVGEEFDPEAFDLVGLNEALARFGTGRRTGR
jgi:Plasmid pRiA4b ORF-3-like protein